MEKFAQVRSWGTSLLTLRKRAGGFEYEVAPEVHDDSPYPEVRASVPNTDDYGMPQSTIRVWTIALILTTVGSAATVMFSVHSPSFHVSPYVSSMAAWPLGRAWEKFMPNKKVWGVPLNPGKFNIKEHALITVCANVAYGSGAAYITSVIVTMQQFYSLNFGIWFELTSVLATQMLGYSIAGLARRVLVYPASMIWPSNLVATTFLTNIHLNVNHTADNWRISRLKFFLLVGLGYSMWAFVPGFLAPCLSYFSIGPWIAPDNVVINQFFGIKSGLGLLPLTFDWNQVSSFMGSPLVPPYFAVANVLASLVLVFWFVTPIVQYSNIWYGKYMPISGSAIWDRFQKPYDVTQVLTENNYFDLKKYQEYSPLYLPTTYILSYCMSFAAITSTVVHTILYDGKDILYYWMNSSAEPDDVHMRLITRYRKVPDFWFLLSFMVFLSLAVVSVHVWDTELPVWALVLALALALVLMIPVAMVYALTNIQCGLNVITEFIAGYLFPGKPVAGMMFKTYGYICNSQSVTFLQDMKLGHYLKIAPRTLFAAQFAATTWSCLVQIFTIRWLQYAVEDFCEPTQKNKFTCPQGRVFFNASVMWGLIGPQRQFGQLYKSAFWWFMLGAFLPLATWLWTRHRPRSWAKLIHWPAFFNGVAYLPPCTLYTYANYCLVGHIFGYWIKRTWFNWWAKYNYSLSCGLDLGMAFGTLLMFLVFQLPSVLAPQWWGTSGAFDNVDTRMDPLIKLPQGEAFGLTQWG